MSLNTTLRFEGDYAAIPERMREGIIRWVEDGQQPGQFLWSVICNNLRGAVWSADDENLPLIPLYVRWFHWECPAGCNGSPERARTWTGTRAQAEPVKNE